MQEEGIERLEVSTVILTGDESTQLLRAEVTTQIVHFSIFTETGMSEILISEEKWMYLMKHINVRLEKLHELKEKARKDKKEVV
jgi:hypothetical protein